MLVNFTNNYREMARNTLIYTFNFDVVSRKTIIVLVTLYNKVHLLNINVLTSMN